MGTAHHAHHAHAMPAAAREPEAWRHGQHYAYLSTTGRAGFAWEWLRRTSAYQTAWRRHRESTSETPRGFGLESWADPGLPAWRARPIWHAAADPGVLAVTDMRPAAGRDDALDLLALAAWVSVAIDGDGDEHWLISDGRWSVRIDIVRGTLLGGPYEPRFELVGVARLTRAIRAMERLRALARAMPIPAALQPDHVKTARWIAELRTADAMAAGAPTRAIAQALFGIEAGTGWRLDQESYRSRTRRLMRTVRQRLRAPVVDYWFGR
jgi:hypothetical protein